MSGPAPKLTRRRRNAPARGEWQASPGIGWQHGPIPEAPAGVTDETRTAWKTWMRAWFATHWTPGDLPGLRIVARLFDRVDRGTASATIRTEMRLWMDSYGITPKGQQERRWLAPQAEAPAKRSKAPPYAHLRAVPNIEETP